MNDKQKTLVKYFEKKVNHYFFKVFKLYDYELAIDSQKDPDSRASAYWYKKRNGAQIITICWSKEWINDIPTKKEVDKVAFHECAEALLSELDQLIKDRYIQKVEIQAAIHRVIRRLENSIFEKLKDE